MPPVLTSLNQSFSFLRHLELATFLLCDADACNLASPTVPAEQMSRVRQEEQVADVEFFFTYFSDSYGLQEKMLQKERFRSRG